MNAPKKSHEEFHDILGNVERYYDEKLRKYGPTPRGVDWNSTESQVLRFEQLLMICDTTKEFSINDYGCGYGALFHYLREKKCVFHYRGFDISAEMISQAKILSQGINGCEFFSDKSRLSTADYAIASGIFNVKLEASNEEWLDYLEATLDVLDQTSRHGFAFNCLTTYSDAKMMRDYLYYADPCTLFDLCKRRFSRHSALLRDYGLYEFTILVRKEP